MKLQNVKHTLVKSVIITAFFTVTIAANAYQQIRHSEYDTTLEYENARAENFLFQGNMPIGSTGWFEVIPLKRGCNRAKDWSLPVLYDLYVISLLNPEVPFEHENLERMQQSFIGGARADAYDITPQVEHAHRRDPTLHWYLAYLSPNIPIDDSLTNSTTWSELDTFFASVSSSQVSTNFTNQRVLGQLVNFDNTVTYVNSLLSTDTVVPKVVYVHSRWGKVRSAVLIAGYLMKYQSYTVEDAFNEAVPDTSKLDNPIEIKNYLYYYSKFLE